MSNSYKTQWVQFVLEIELRQDGDVLRKLFNSLINCAVLHLIGARLRRDRPVTSNLAQALQHYLWADIGQLRQVYLTMCARSEPLDISRPLAWIMFISPLQLPYCQHDAAEFAQHIAPRIHSYRFSGVWQARQVVGALSQTVDSAPAHTPVLLPMTGTANLQNFIDQWHAQDDSGIVHAFSANTQIVLFQLMRFNVVGRGRRKHVVKDSMRVNGLMADLNIPLFVDDASHAVHYSVFEVSATVVHYGIQADSGHYRSIWNGKRCKWITEDGIAAQECTDTDPIAMECNAYLIWATRSSTGDSGPAANTAIPDC
ncbi:unnamed protein product [Symbiodinium sp. CCMP2592]|nr:unnamed protein product [Symbiodinium sp. CCMP2592]